MTNAWEIEAREAPAFISAYETRFPAQCRKFSDYMGWERKPKTEK